MFIPEYIQGEVGRVARRNRRQAQKRLGRTDGIDGQQIQTWAERYRRDGGDQSQKNRVREETRIAQSEEYIPIPSLEASSTPHGLDEEFDMKHLKKAEGRID